MARLLRSEGWCRRSVHAEPDPDARQLARHLRSMLQGIQLGPSRRLKPTSRRGARDGTGVGVAVAAGASCANGGTRSKTRCVNAQTGQVVAGMSRGLCRWHRGRGRCVLNWHRCRAETYWQTVAFPVMKKDATPIACFTTGAMRVESDRRHHLPVIGTIRTYENTRLG